MSQLSRRGLLFGFLAMTQGCLSNSLIHECKESNKRALLVCPYEFRKDDIGLMTNLLSRRGYSLTLLEGMESSEGTILNVLEEFAKGTTSTSKTIFYYTGHYTTLNFQNERYKVDTGGVIVNDSREQRLSPMELFSALKRIQGKKSAIIDACHSGVYTDNVTGCGLENYVVLAACPFGTETATANSYIKGKRVGSLTYGLLNVLNSQQNVNLSTADIKCGNKEKRSMTQDELRLISNQYIFPISFEMQRAFDTDFWI